ncbi:MAG: PEPxxWA-CTERM sorting domain-containing protein [Phenylobacterium sp.]|uniref:PEPxxWA-CTERM sorting domain-containing protein n=1 Tax=Phenylobacterium sp. TaxID=1871053 RepID=UPI001A5AE290|nr:PEPxxWA-CTERM sorting domain-containing protein [Phenylobacterium sp.]MBL8769830.1 PEPxxWA-CTERM sorting domain-containing protein [Phenylobacterium sp.]
MIFSRFSRPASWAATAGCAAALIGAAGPAAATVTVYEDLPTANAQPPNISWHNASGPVIADDFNPIKGGSVTHLTWWGSEAEALDFEVVLQNDNPVLHQPANTPDGNTFSGGLKQFVTATSFAYSIPGIFQFEADVAPGWNIAAGQTYWLTVANVNNGWQWTQALNGPTVGSEAYNAHWSTGPGCLDGGPHCGPWTDLHTDFAFRIGAVPEPATWGLMIMGFGGAGAMLRRARRAAGAVLA